MSSTPKNPEILAMNKAVPVAVKQPGRCPHNRRRYYCKDCGGSQICKHGLQRSKCKPCGGSQICQYNTQLAHCKSCRLGGLRSDSIIANTSIARSVVAPLGRSARNPPRKGKRKSFFAPVWFFAFLSFSPTLTKRVLLRT